MEVPEQSDELRIREARNSISVANMNNLRHSTEYIMSSIRQHSLQQERRQQPQLLLVKNKLLSHTDY